MSDRIVKRLSLEEMQYIADEIRKYIKRKASEFNVSEKSLHRILDYVPVVVSCLDRGEGASVTSPAHEVATFFPQLEIHLKRRNFTKAQIIAHELAEALMYEWVAPHLYHKDRVVCTDELDIPGVRHNIAQLVDKPYARK